MDGHVKEKLRLVEIEEVLGYNKVAGAAHRQEFGKVLEASEAQSLKQAHRSTRGGAIR